ncbi:MAG: tandem-95 repeat protein, partial [Myxococcaceae bacterium]|nr:tandem-95 repeat protein [Myxococcaceae bacterium]
MIQYRRLNLWNWAAPLLGALIAACSAEPPLPAGPAASEPVAVSSSALVGVDGNYTVTTAGDVLNRYTPLRASAAAGSTSIQVETLTNLNSPQFGPLAPGDLLMIIQMQGASINTTNSANFGAVTALNGAGDYELLTVDTVASGGGGSGVITIRTDGCGGLRNSYTPSRGAQVVRVPQLASLTVNAGASVAALPWDGTRGGVIALQVQNALTLQGTLNADGAGFRGGAVEQGTNYGVTTYRSTNGGDGAEKGEGIAGYKATYDAFGGRYGRGAAANGGGGGNAHNAGGGGGANGNNGVTWTGQGIMTGTFPGQDPWRLDPAYIANGNARTSSSGGGRGGYTYSSDNQNAVTLGPGNGAWGGDSRYPVGGLGGRPVANDPASRLFLGGGGGAGDSNNNTGGTGGRGGGLVWVVADTVTGSGRISANGQNGTDTINTGNDAPGGGGAGGTVVVAARALSGVTIDANGGRGGNQNITLPAEAEGPGGGGGGGYIAVSGGTVTRTVAGGQGGRTNSPSLSEFTQNGATDAAPGQLGAAVVTLPLCLPSDLAITVTDGVTTVAPGSTVTYTINVTNLGPNAVTGASVTDLFPATLMGVSWTCTSSAGAACATPSGTGNINGALLTLASGSSVSFTVTATVNPAATGTLVNTASVAAPQNHTDPSSANNTATDTDTLTPRADLAVSLSDAPDPVLEDGTLTYAVNVNNLGPSTATSLTATLNLPAGTTFVSGTGTGWTCGHAGGVVTCTRPSADPGALPAITVQVTAPAVGGTITATATVSAATTDPVSGNNSASQNTTVTPVNDPPNAVDDTFTVTEDSGVTILAVLANDTAAPDTGETLIVAAVSQPATGGTVTLSGGQVRFTPSANFNGTVTFTYTVSDGNGGTDTATVMVTVTPVNDPPNAVDDTFTVSEDSAATVVPVLANDTTAPETGETLTLTGVSQPATGGTVTLSGGVVRFTPSANFTGTVTFTYTVSDGNGGTDTATVTVTVTAVNDPPNAVDDALTVNEDSGVTVVPVLANDTTAPDTGETLTVTGVSQPATGGTVTLSGGQVSFTPAPNFSGPVTFTYTVSDGNGGTDTATVTVTVVPVNDPPDAVNDALTVSEDSAATVVPVLANDTTAPDTGETLTVTGVSLPVNGTATLSGGVVSYQPNPNFSGTDTFTYTVSDGNGATDTATVTVTVTAVNDPPNAVDDAL